MGSLRDVWVWHLRLSQWCCWRSMSVGMCALCWLVKSYRNFDKKKSEVFLKSLWLFALYDLSPAWYCSSSKKYIIGMSLWELKCGQQSEQIYIATKPLVTHSCPDHQGTAFFSLSNSAYVVLQICRDCQTFSNVPLCAYTIRISFYMYFFHGTWIFGINNFNNIYWSSFDIAFFQCVRFEMKKVRRIECQINLSRSRK
jgi:hypothetical protein